jgi:sialate O-acetylesterase
MKTKLFKISGLITLLLLISFYSFADVTLPHIIGSNMVIQANKLINIWGQATAGEQVTVQFMNQTKKVTTNNSGQWKVVLDPIKASTKPTEMTISGKNTIKLENVLVGEVWICSGQSNMEFSLAKGLSWKTGVNDWEKEVSEANYPELRLFIVKIKKSDAPLTDCEGEWVVCTSKNVGTFSAVGYYFGRYLTQQLHQPVGMIETSVGGTRAELWTKMKVMENDTLYNIVFDQYKSDLKKFEAYSLAMKQWNEKTNNGKDSTLKIAPPVKVGQPSKPACLWNAMVEPLLPLTIKGAIWYQGESNEPQAYDYRFVFANMINSWRKEWKQGDFPFYYVQIAAHKDKTPLLRYSQTYVLKSVKNTGMAVATDVGDSLNIHPRNKTIIGERLAFWALAKDYGFKNVTFSGPVYKSMKINGKTIELSFNYAEKGLMVKGGDLKEFEIAGPDKQFYSANASIHGNNVIVSSPHVTKPVYARYAWKNFMHPNFYNQQGLPAVPFNTEK